MSKAKIYEVVDDLPTGSVTVHMLRALDFVIPGQWQNVVGFEETIKVVTGETDQEMVQKIGERAIHLFNDRSQGYQRALWLYQTIDSADNALAAAVLADKVGEKIGFLSFLSKVTPKADTAQALDLSLKLVGEIVTFCQISGIPGDSVGDFVRALSDYSGEELMRMTAMICVDGLIPLGPDFIDRVITVLEQLDAERLEQNKIYQRINSLIPGDGASEQLGFIRKSIDSVQGWMRSFVEERDLSVDQIVGKIKQYVEVTDDKLDYLGAFLDMTTNYYEHTGTQTLARRLIQRAVSEI